jgi:hypothetical protein
MINTVNFQQIKLIAMSKKLQPYKTSFKSYFSKKNKLWNKKSKPINKGHINILKFAYLTSVYWAMERNENKIPNISIQSYFKLMLTSLF